MLGGVIVTHGSLGKELLETAKRIVGKIKYIESVEIGWDDDVEEARKLIKQCINRVNRGAGVIVFTDMFGGTPSNLAFTFLKKGRVEVITGVNLPMILKFIFSQKSTDLDETAKKVVEEGKKSIYPASSVFKED